MYRVIFQKATHPHHGTKLSGLLTAQRY